LINVNSGGRSGRGLIVRQLKVGAMENFVYLLADEGTKEGVVVDSGWETGPIVRAAAEAGVKVKYAVATHGHFDHVSTLDEIAAKLGAYVVAHEKSEVRCDVKVADGSVLEVGSAKVKVLHTPGHTEDSISLYDGRGVFTGDTLFVGTIGRFERERSAEMYRSLYDVILGLPPHTVVYPGHDYGDVPSRTLLEERGANPYLGCKDLRGFLSLFSPG
jgi:hydroxyacylglutathione hydrolase